MKWLGMLVLAEAVTFSLFGLAYVAPQLALIIGMVGMPALFGGTLVWLRRDSEELHDEDGL